jgi:hypothetical protein
MTETNGYLRGNTVPGVLEPINRQVRERNETSPTIVPRMAVLIQRKSSGQERNVTVSVRGMREMSVKTIIFPAIPESVI